MSSNEPKGRSNNKLQSVRGTQDFIGESAFLFRRIEELALHHASLFGYEEIKTPIFEFSEVFHRSLGETSDAVSKETYDFKDRGGDSLTLRPEGTAGVVRAFVSNGMAQHLPLRLYYSGPMFRYERPQKGRFRQFHQIGVEALGFENPEADVESMALAWQMLSALGLSNKSQLEINTLGDRESRDRHRQALVDYLTPFRSELSADSQIRLEKNPLRILDSKDEKDQRLLPNAPRMENYLNDTSKNFFDKVLAGLETLKIPYVRNSHLVRGLDYYTHTVFEFTTTHLGAQSALLAGGRYDGLVEMMGGSATPGVGWGSGIERLALLVSPELFAKKNTIVAVIAAEESTESYCMALSQKLRLQDLQVEFMTAGNMGKRFKRAAKINASYAVVVGGNEIQSGTVAIKDLKTGTQTSVPMTTLNDFKTSFKLN